MSDAARKRAVTNYRARLTQRGLARFEVQAPDADRDLLRALARQLAEDGPEAARTRALVQDIVAGKPPHGAGGILSALRRSPLVGADLDLLFDGNMRRLNWALKRIDGLLGTVAGADGASE